MSIEKGSGAEMSKQLLRRAAPALAVTGAAFTLVIAFDPALLGVTTAGQSVADTATRADAGAATDTESGTGTAAGTASGTGTDTESGTSTETGTDTGTGSASGTDAEAGTSTGNTDSCTSATIVTGDIITTRFGPVQVEAEVAGSTLCSVAAVAWPVGDPKSTQINAYAIPVLDERASAVGAAFDAVSGATYTSQGYRSSLQSILDRL
jgi:uncharacterized protein with FMN-binding domain